MSAFDFAHIPMFFSNSSDVSHWLLAYRTRTNPTTVVVALFANYGLVLAIIPFVLHS